MSLIGLSGVVSLGCLASLGGCGGNNASGISIANAPRDLGGFVVPSQAAGPDAATQPGAADFAAPANNGTPDLATGSPGNNCGSVPATGICSSATLEYCDPTAGLQSIDCSSVGLTCAVDSSTGLADCVAPSTGGGGTGSGCGTIDSDGICMGSTLEYCSSSNKLVTKDCSASGKSCTVSSSGYAQCK